VRQRHLIRDLQRLLPHGRTGSKVDTDEGLGGVVQACEDADCGAALLLDARDAKRLYLWAAGCPDGPSAMFRVRNLHTVAELNLEARRCLGVRNLLAFDSAFDASPERRVYKALLTRILAVPRGAARRTAATGGLASVRDSIEHVRHTFMLAWVDDRIWLRVYRIGRGLSGKLDVEEIGPRLVLEPVRIIASGFGGAILHENAAFGQAGQGSRADPGDDSEPE